MNKAILMGRLTKDVETRYTQSTENMAISKFSIAVDRKGKDKEADFINVVAFGKNGEFAEKYFKKGMKVVVEGHIQTGSYTDRDGKKVYTTDIVAESFEFAESKKEESKSDDDGFFNIEHDEDLPFAR